MQTIIDYTAQRQVNIGDVFYTIEKTNSKFYYEACKVCGGTRQVTVNGVTFACPCCDKQQVRLTISQYKVLRWRVYGVNQFVSRYYWKPSTDKTTEFLLYRIKSKGELSFNATITNKINTTMLNKRYNLDYEEIKTSINGYLSCNDFIFDCYSLAVKVANQLNDAERQIVINHNKEHGTNYELPENPKHDPKN